MKGIKLLAALGLAAATAGTSGAMAADLPVAPEPVDYVRVCDAFGTGFFYIPGTETCLRISGRVRAEYRFNDFGDRPNAWNRASNGTSTRARGVVRFDARTNTEYGLVRSYIDLYLQRDSAAGTFTELDNAFIQFGNFTFGRTQSMYDFWTGYSYGNYHTQYTDYRNWMAAYTAALGNGISATVSIEDGTTRRWSLVGGGDAYSGHRLPDLVANLRIEQGWGSAQIMGALHDVRYAAANTKGDVGFAIGAGIQLNVPVFGATDNFAIQAMYGDGASGYVLDSWSGLVTATDATFAGGRSHTTKAWSIGAGFLHNFSDQLEGSIEGGYASMDAFGRANDFTQWGGNLNLIWKPVAGLGIGGELAYRMHDLNRASGVRDADEMAVTLRVERNF
ncbi:porin [Microvirga tunisiensis]|uniref:Porin n=2 Tax=Pannonibacter tanglangensis TaxID=2750084 RepID=A0A7X5F3U7_9HYPH|nr:MULTISPECIES: porin [unclassified Pannonibacter]NBN64462.1 porin [Pannonibacter sp. XCT-34]NBN78994.1 porin [Pannonibacter sp. XCT-53]